MMIAASYPAGFKIKSKADLLKAVDHYLTKNHEFIIKIDAHTALFFEISTKNGLLVSTKHGDLHDMWNATIACYPGDELDTLWKYRKHLNARFFS